MAISRVQGTRLSNGASSLATVAVVLGAPIGSGNIATASFTWVSIAGDQLVSVKDDKGNLWRIVGQPVRDATNGFSTQTAYCLNITNAPQTITGTLNIARTSFAGVVDEFTGFASSSLVLDGYSGNTQTIGVGTDNAVSGNITTTANGNLIVGYTGTWNGNGTTHGTGFTLGFQTGGGNCLSEWEVQTSAGTVQATWNNTTLTDTYISFVLSFKVQSGAQTYFVSPTGSDGNNGTSSGTPWATPTSATSRVNTTTYNGGDTINFQGGQTFSTSFLSWGTQNWGLNPAPSSSNPVTIGSYGAGNATISSGSNAGFLFLNLSGFILQNLTFTAGAGNPAVDGVQVQTNLQSGSRLSYVQLLNLTVSGYGLNGINVWGNGGNTSGFDSVTISGCITHDNTATGTASTAGIRVHGIYPIQNTNTNVKITGCTSYNNAGLTGATNWTGTGIIIQETSGTSLIDVNGNACGALIDTCVAHDNGANSNLSSGGNYGIWMAVVTGGVIQRCESYSNKTQTKDGGGYDLDGGCINCTIQYCYSHDNDGQGYNVYQYTDTGLADSSGNTVRYCISQNDGANATNTDACCCLIGNDSGSTGQTGVAVYNNTFYTSRAAVPAVNLEGSGLANITGHVSSNIFYLNGATNFVNNVVGTGNPTGLVFSGNDYYTTSSFSLAWNGTTYTSFASWVAAATQQEPIAQRLTSPTVNPSLVNPGGGGTLGGYMPSSLPQYQLSFGSPMVGVGLDLNSLYSISPGTADFFGNAMPNGRGTGFNVGAYAGLPVTAVSSDVIGGCEMSLTARSANERRRTAWWS